MAQNKTCPIWMFKGEDGEIHVDLSTDGDSIWVTQRQMGEFFQVGTNTINYHVKAIYETGELDPEKTSKVVRETRIEGVREVVRDIAYYNLRMIIAVGYKAKSERGSQFRQWASKQLNSYLIDGFTIHMKRLIEGQKANTDYFLDLLDKIKTIRTANKPFYQQIVNIYATSIDYNRESETTKSFLNEVVDKFYVAITGQTQAQLIANRADASKDNMGMTSNATVNEWNIETARNYLTEEEESLFQSVTIKYIDYATLQASKLAPMHMADWAKRLDQFLEFNIHNEDKPLFEPITFEEAKKRVQAAYEVYEQQRQDILANEPDEFEKLMKAIGK